MMRWLWLIVVLFGVAYTWFDASPIVPLDLIALTLVIWFVADGEPARKAKEKEEMEEELRRRKARQESQ